MIRYDLRCDTGHEFDAWFRDSAGFEALRLAGEVSCPICGDSKVEKALMAPALGRAAKPPTGALKSPAPDQAAPDQTAPVTAALAPPATPLQAALTALRQKLETEATYVGPRFAAEARRQHVEETEAKPIWGEATPEEARDLLSEGIPIAPLPPLPRRDD